MRLMRFEAVSPSAREGWQPSSAGKWQLTFRAERFHSLIGICCHSVLAPAHYEFSYII